MSYTGIEDTGTNNMISTGSVLHHVNPTFHWTLVHHGSQSPSYVCIYAQGYLLMLSMHNMVSRSLETEGSGCGSHWELDLLKHTARLTIESLRESSVLLNVPHMNHIPLPVFCSFIWKESQMTKCPIPHWTGPFNPISLSSFFILNSLILSPSILSAHSAFWFLCLPLPCLYCLTVFLQKLEVNRKSLARHLKYFAELCHTVVSLKRRQIKETIPDTRTQKARRNPLSSHCAARHRWKCALRGLFVV